MEPEQRHCDGCGRIVGRLREKDGQILCPDCYGGERRRSFASLFLERREELTEKLRTMGEEE